VGDVPREQPGEGEQQRGQEQAPGPARRDPQSSVA
jgi:hypothetical protein